MANYETMVMSDVSAMSAIILISLVALIIQGFWLWHSARNNQNWWFVAILVINTVGLLPLLYILFFRLDREKIDFFGKKRSKKKRK